jgi:DNA-directed RNA polymerase subunit beta'
MLRRVAIREVGDTDFLIDDQVSREEFEKENERIIAEDGNPAVGEPIMLGITKASLSTESFISAASFQETTKVLTQASIEGKEDHLCGLKENVIMGRLIPAGTGIPEYRTVKVQAPEPEAEKEEQDLEETDSAQEKQEKTSAEV